MDKEESTNNELLKELIKKKVNAKTTKLEKELNKLKKTTQKRFKKTHRGA